MRIWTWEGLKMKKIMCSLIICACFAGSAYAKENPKNENQAQQQDVNSHSEQSAEDTARQKYALDIKKLGISKAVKNALKEGTLPVKDLIALAIVQGVKPVSVLTSMSINGVNSNDIIASRVEGVTADLVTMAYTAVEQLKTDVVKSESSSKAVKSAIEAGVLSVENVLDVAVMQGANTNNVLTSLSLSGVSANDIIAARVEGVSAEHVATAYAAVEQFKSDVAKSDNADAAVKSAIEAGVLSLDSIIEVAVVQGINPTNVLTAMNNSGVNVNDATNAASAVGITADTVQQTYNNPVEPSDIQAYTPPEDRGQQPNSPSDRGQRPDTMPVNAATPATPTFSLPVGPIGGGTNGPPENFTPASPSRPI